MAKRICTNICCVVVEEQKRERIIRGLVVWDRVYICNKLCVCVMTSLWYIPYIRESWGLLWTRWWQNYYTPTFKQIYTHSWSSFCLSLSFFFFSLHLSVFIISFYLTDRHTLYYMTRKVRQNLWWFSAWMLLLLLLLCSVMPHPGMPGFTRVSAVQKNNLKNDTKKISEEIERERECV